MSLNTDENGAVTLSKARHDVCIQVAYELEALAYVLPNVGSNCRNDSFVALFAVRGIADRYLTLSNVLLAALDDDAETTDHLASTVGITPHAVRC